MRKIMRRMVSVSLMFILMLVGITGCAGQQDTQNEKEKQAKETAAAEDLPETFDREDLEVKVYGDMVDFPEDVTWTEVDQIDDHIYDSDREYVYFVLNNLSGKLDVSDDELLKIYELTDLDPGYNFIYLGYDIFPQLESLGMSNGPMTDDELSYSYVTTNGGRRRMYGTWSEKDQKAAEESKDSLGDALVVVMETNIKNKGE